MEHGETFGVPIPGTKLVEEVYKVGNRGPVENIMFKYEMDGLVKGQVEDTRALILLKKYFWI